MNTDYWVKADKEHCWHPFTQQQEWSACEPLVITEGKGVWLKDSEGREYIDGNSSIWTNIHGHNHPIINTAITEQLSKVSHTSYLGFANPRASELAKRLSDFFPSGSLDRVFFSDDGSTAVECAVKMAIQYRMQTNEPDRCQFIAFDQAYHGDTMGAASLGGVGSFFDRFRKFGFPVNHVKSMACLAKMEQSEIDLTAAVIIEPLVQGVNQINVWPKGLLDELRKWCDTHSIHLILDEVMTGFGRTGEMFACHQEKITPDFLCLAKGLTGGYMPLAATLVKEEIYNAFLGGRDKAFYYGHSYTANPLGCAAALANLDLFESEQTLERLPEKIHLLNTLLNKVTENHDVAYEVRQCGLVAGLELRQSSGEKFPVEARMGEILCLYARKHQLLTRPILDTIVIMPPLSISLGEITIMCDALDMALAEMFPEI